LEGKEFRSVNLTNDTTVVGLALIVGQASQVWQGSCNTWSKIV
jgi:hypothetical protein